MSILTGSTFPITILAIPSVLFIELRQSAELFILKIGMMAVFIRWMKLFARSWFISAAPSQRHSCMISSYASISSPFLAFIIHNPAVICSIKGCLYMHHKAMNRYSGKWINITFTLKHAPNNLIAGLVIIASKKILTFLVESIRLIRISAHHHIHVSQELSSYYYIFARLRDYKKRENFDTCAAF